MLHEWRSAKHAQAGPFSISKSAPTTSMVHRIQEALLLSLSISAGARFGLARQNLARSWVLKKRQTIYLFHLSNYFLMVMLSFFWRPCNDRYSPDPLIMDRRKYFFLQCRLLIYHRWSDPNTTGRVLLAARSMNPLSWLHNWVTVKGGAISSQYSDATHGYIS
jgi:hypothetical protein